MISDNSMISIIQSQLIGLIFSKLIQFADIFAGFKMNYYVIEFAKDNTIEPVPEIWLVDMGVSCRWPPNTFTREQLDEAIRSCLQPDPTFSLQKVRTNWGKYGELFLKLPNFFLNLFLTLNFLESCVQLDFCEVMFLFHQRIFLIILHRDFLGTNYIHVFPRTRGDRVIVTIE